MHSDAKKNWMKTELDLKAGVRTLILELQVHLEPRPCMTEHHRVGKWVTGRVIDDVRER
jgi:hypothetical protein